MNFSGNVLQTTLDLLSTFSHQQLKTIEAALSLSTSTTSNTSNCNNGTATTNQQQSFNYFDSHCHTPPTWTEESETTTATTASLADFEELDTMNSGGNNLPKVQGSAAGGGHPPPNNVAEYLAIQQQAQQFHQQQTQQQNQALAAAAGGQQTAPLLCRTPFDTNPSLLVAGGKGGAPIAGHGPLVPPLAMAQQPLPNPQQMLHHLQQPHQQQQKATTAQPQVPAQRQPLALTSTPLAAAAAFNNNEAPPASNLQTVRESRPFARTNLSNKFCLVTLIEMNYDNNK